MKTIHYEIEYQAGDHWFASYDGDGHPYIFGLPEAAQDAALAVQGLSNGTRYRAVKVEITRTRV